MKTKIIFVLIFIAIFSVGIVFMVFLTQKQGSIIPKPELQPAEERPAEQQPESKTPQSTMMATDYFTIILPPGWEDISEPDTLPIIVANSQEKITNEKAKEIDFRTNLSINRAKLGEGVSSKDYIEGVKTGLINTIPIIEIVKEEETTLNDREAHFLEIESIQEDLKFETLVVFIVGKENTIWAISFNTLEESWPDYKEIFYQIAQSFKIK